MLDQKSAPVWMLADVMFVLLVGSLFVGIAVLPMAMRAVSAPVPQETDAVNLRNARRELQRQVQQEEDAQIAASNEADQLKSQLNAANTTLQQSALNVSVVENRVVELQKQLKFMTATRDQSVAQLTALQANANATAKKSTSDLLDVQLQLTALQGNSAAEKSVRQELLGLKGDMSRTLFIIDISASMTNAFPGSYARPNWQAGDNAWINVRRRIRDYLELLPVGSFRILCFNHELIEHPYDTAIWCRTTEERSGALAFLDQRTPVGLTFTEAALRRAALFQPTSILLFTDGQPTQAVDEKQPDGTVKSVGEVDVEQQQRILKLHDEKVLTCPVNVVALNGYADPVFFSFLQELAGRTGGSFQGL